LPLFGLPVEKREGLFSANQNRLVNWRARERTVGNNLSVASGVVRGHDGLAVCSRKFPERFLIEHQFVQFLRIFHFGTSLQMRNELYQQPGNPREHNVAEPQPKIKIEKNGAALPAPMELMTLIAINVS
jgi:hypothetical protein